MFKKKTESLTIKLFKNSFLIVLLVIIVTITIIFFLNRNNIYTNTVYNYRFEYPKTSKIDFISSLKGNTNIFTADTIGVNLSPSLSIRIQVLEKPYDSNVTIVNTIQLGKNKFDYIKTQAPCNYILSDDKKDLCLLVNLVPEQLLKEKEAVDLLKSIKLF